MNEIDYGPLLGLLGHWQGEKGIDKSPEPEGTDISSFYESLIFTGIDEYVENAESQLLATVHYRQIVRRKSNDKVFHDESGYWMWDSHAKLIMQTFSIPRGVSVVAGGSSTFVDGATLLTVTASDSKGPWQISQSPFMVNNARTLHFEHEIKLLGNTLSYHETMILDIYGNEFKHTDESELTRVN